MTKINELFLSHKPRKIVANREQIPLSGKVARVRFGVVAAARIDESGAAIYYRLFTKDELLGLLPYQMEYFAVSHASLDVLSVDVVKRQDLTELLLRELLTDNRAMSNYMAAARKPFCEFLRWCLAQLDEAATESGYPDKAFYRLASKPRVRNGILATLTLLTGSPSPAVCRALKKVRHEFN